MIDHFAFSVKTANVCARIFTLVGYTSFVQFAIAVSHALRLAKWWVADEIVFALALNFLFRVKGASSMLSTRFVFARVNDGLIDSFSCRKHKVFNY